MNWLANTVRMFCKWLEDEETWIGIFENQDLSDGDVGVRTAMAFDENVYDEAEVGKSRAPDTAVGFVFDFVGSGVQPGLIKVKQNNVAAVLGQAGGQGETESAAATGDKGFLAG